MHTVPFPRSYSHITLLPHNARVTPCHEDHSGGDYGGIWGEREVYDRGSQRS